MNLSAKVIGVLEILAAGIFGFVTLNAMALIDKSATYLTFMGIGMGVLATLLNLVAGILLLNSNSRTGYVLSLVNTAFQIPTINLPGFGYVYVGLGQIFAGVGAKGLIFGANISPGRFFVGLGSNEGFQITLNFVALAFTIFLWRGLRELRQ